MKKQSAFFLFFCLAISVSAQVTAKKYLLVEHFTNSNCSVCASRNPALNNLINQAQYADDLHHVSIHPMFPYPQCVFYQANTAENTAWTALYPVQGTPTIVLNGTTQTPSNPLLTEAKLQTYLNQTSPVHLKVTESGPNNARSVTVRVKTLGDVPSGTYKIFAAVVEKTVDQQTGNGETVHYNVFREMLSAVSGDDFTLPALGATTDVNFEYSIANNWDANEVYVLAFIKEVNTKQVLNSGTRFDLGLSGTGEIAVQNIQISPNPVSDFAWLDLPGDAAQTVEVFASSGQRVSVAFERQGNAISVPMATFSPGVYFLKIAGEKGVYTGKFVKN